MKFNVGVLLTFFLQFVDKFTLPEQHWVLLALGCFLLQQAKQTVLITDFGKSPLLFQNFRETSMVGFALIGSEQQIQIPSPWHLRFSQRTFHLFSSSRLHQTHVKFQSPAWSRGPDLPL